MRESGRSREPLSPFPDPLASGAWWSEIGAWAPPAVVLSALSACVGLLALVFLQRDADMRNLFSLVLVDNARYNRAITLALALFTAAWAWLIVFCCRRRPGPLWPRLWALGLALSASAVALVEGLGPPQAMPSADAAVLACFAAVLVLSLRLLRLQPDSPWLQRLATMGLLLALLTVLPALYCIGGDRLKVLQHGLNGAIGSLRAHAEILERCAKTEQGCSLQAYRAAFEQLQKLLDNPAFRNVAARQDRTLMMRQNELANEQAVLLEKLAAELPKRLARELAGNDLVEGDSAEAVLEDFKRLWEKALQLGKSAPMQQAYGKLLESLIASAPPLLREAPAHYADAANGPWDKNPAFDATSRQVLDHYERLKALLTALGSFAENGGEAALPLQSGYSDQYHGAWEKRLRALETSWAEHWLLPYLSSDQPLNADTPMPWLPLAKVMHMPVIGKLTAADIDGLLDLPRQDAERLVDTGQASNCQKNLQEERIFSLRCHAYIASAKDKVELRAGLQVIYELQKNANKPDRIVFFLPLPPDTQLETFAYDLQKIFPESTQQAVRHLLKAMELQKSGQEGGPVDSQPQCPPKTGNACAEMWEYLKGTGRQYLKLVVYR